MSKLFLLGFNYYSLIQAETNAFSRFRVLVFRVESET